MSGPKSNFDGEIKKGMAAKAKPKQQQKNPNSSTNDAPGNGPPAASGKFNETPPGAPAAPPALPQAINTAQAMHDAGQAHMAAIHAHINSMKGGV